MPKKVNSQQYLANLANTRKARPDTIANAIALDAIRSARKKPEQQTTPDEANVSPERTASGSTGISKLICRSVHEQTAQYLLDYIERNRRLPDEAMFVHSGNTECKVIWKKQELTFKLV